MRDETFAKLLNVLAERDILSRQLRERFGEPVARLHFLPPKRANELVFVIARYCQSMRVAHHPHREAKHSRDVWPTINQVAEEYRLATLWMRCVDRTTDLVEFNFVSELAKQCLEF